MAQRRRANALKFKKGKGLKLAVTLIFSAALIAIPLRASSQTPAITPKNSIDQTLLERGKYTFARVLSSGGDFFSTPYTPFDRDTGEGDGHGEGPNGPRSQQIQAFYKDHPGYPFLRLNGIDSQSCYECHNSIGSFEGYQGAQMRTPYSVGGSAGANSNAFINPAFPNPLTTFIRNPPHVFGAGYTQEVAAEMTEELQTEVAVARSISKITKQPKTVDLEAKGMSFGKFTTTYTGGPGQVNGCPQGELCGQYPAMLQVDGYTDDVSEVTGIECDIVVRPLQWKGIASSIRHFVRDALDFHFSMQAEEKYGLVLDCDKDGKPGPANPHPEMSIGNVSALVTFVSLTRPPQQVWPTDPVQKRQAKIGEQIFEGTYAPLKDKLKGQMCATCHNPSFTMDSPWLTIENPGLPDFNEYPFKGHDPCTILNAGLVDASGTTASLPLIKRLNERLQRANIDAIVRRSLTANVSDKQILTAAKQAVKKTHVNEVQAVRGLLAQAAIPSLPSIYVNLQTPMLAKETGPPSIPAYLQKQILPRLPGGASGIKVPLFSDLRTHNMGTGLQDYTGDDQGTDVTGLCVRYPFFLTRSLWGVADTGPWLHDGRARTLREAILLHESNGSEANDIIEAFKSLPAQYQQDVVDFLLTLKLLPPPGNE